MSARSSRSDSRTSDADGSGRYAPATLNVVTIIGASAAVLSALIGGTVLVLNVLWRRPLLTISFVAYIEAGRYDLGLRNDGGFIVRDIQGQALLDGKPLAGVDPVGPWTVGPDKEKSGSFQIPREAFGDRPDPSRLSARVSRPRRFRRKSVDVKSGERSATLR